MSVNGTVKLKKGFDVSLAGKAATTVEDLPLSEVVAVKPSDFLDTIPKMMVQVGDEVLAGSPLFYSKDRPELKFTSPVSGEVIEIRRGEKRKILEVRILPDKEIRYVDFKSRASAASSKEALTELLLESGTWNYIKQRPYNVIADPQESPKGIFVSGFDTSPLAPVVPFVLEAYAEAFQKGMHALKAFGVPVHLSLQVGESSTVYKNLDGIKIHYFSGPHPAGNVGIQIHHLSPIKDGSQTAWTIQAQDVVIIGRLILEGAYKPERILPLCGSEVNTPKYYRMLTGSSLEGLLNGRISNGQNRIILGNVLTGHETAADGFLGFYDYQVTVIPEVTEPEFMGWLLPGFDKLSLSRTFFSWLIKKDNYVMNTSMNGEGRNFVVSGEYEKVLPMNIMPVQLLKAIMARDFEMMEKLGIYEIAEEDFALCEFVCTSKIAVQSIVREGLDLMRKEG